VNDNNVVTLLTQSFPLITNAVVVIVGNGLRYIASRFDYGGEYRDKFWLALFLVHLIIMFVAASFYDIASSCISLVATVTQ
jgi:hypothetical protein